MKLEQYLNEVKATYIGVGNEFTLSGDIGIFSKGEKVKVTKITPFGNDIEIKLTNQNGDDDVFYLDRNDNFEELD
jgi:hypothetical protein